jgi:transposase
MMDVVRGIDIAKNSFHVVGLDQRGAIVERQRWMRSQIGARLANPPPCLIGMEARVGAHPQTAPLGHNAQPASARLRTQVERRSKGAPRRF